MFVACGGFGIGEIVCLLMLFVAWRRDNGDEASDFLKYVFACEYVEKEKAMGA
jgi:hypothetical protein